MDSVLAAMPDTLKGVERVMGELRGRRPGPTLICVAGVHGNEPAGVLGLQRVLTGLNSRTREICGEFVAVAGNLQALAEGCRFVQCDLNRAWTRRRVRRLGKGAAAEAGAEDREQAELLQVLERVALRARGPLYVLDLHTTSGRGGAFSTVSDHLENRSFAEKLPVPMILGLEEQVEGTLLDYLNEQGYVTAGVESGQHREPESVDRAEAAVWIALVASGLLTESSVPEAQAARERLARDAAGLPRVLEMRYRHPITDGDGFRMRRGYENFRPVKEGEVLGSDRSGDVRSPESARILMPLYQEQGEEGFFIVREFRPVWLWVSKTLRRLPIARHAHWLPGIRRSERHPDMLLVNRKIARIYALELFHLLGYRKYRELGSKLVVVVRHPKKRR